MLLTLDEGHLLTTTVPDLQRGMAPLGPPVPVQPPFLRLLLLATGPGLGRGWLLPAAVPGLGLRVAPQGHRPWPQARGGLWLLLAAPDLRRGVPGIKPLPPGVETWSLNHLTFREVPKQVFLLESKGLFDHFPITSYFDSIYPHVSMDLSPQIQRCKKYPF